MDEFESLVDSIDKEEMKSFLGGLSQPCFESQLLKIAFPNFNIAVARPLALYRHHFALFHLLYQFQEELHRQHKFLFVHFMRTFLADYPEESNCRYYYEETGQFCNTQCIPEKNYCALHGKSVGEMELDEISIKYFYLDGNNFYGLDEETIEAFMNGAWHLLKNNNRLKQALATLGLPETSDLKLVRQRFKYLAMTLHPDITKDNHEKFCEINGAYHFLLKCASAFSRRIDDEQ